MEAFKQILSKIKSMFEEMNNLVEMGKIMQPGKPMAFLQTHSEKLREMCNEIYDLGSNANTGIVAADEFLKQLLTKYLCSPNNSSIPIQIIDIKSYPHNFTHGSFNEETLNSWYICYTYSEIYINRIPSQQKSNIIINSIDSLLDVDNNKIVDTVLQLGNRESQYNWAASYYIVHSLMIVYNTIEKENQDLRKHISKLDYCVNNWNTNFETIQSHIDSKLNDFKKQINNELEVRDVNLAIKQNSIVTLENEVDILKRENEILRLHLEKNYDIVDSLKSKIMLIEQKHAPELIEYDYDAIKSRIDPFRDELMIVQRTFARIIRNKNNLPIAVPVPVK